MVSELVPGKHTLVFTRLFEQWSRNEKDLHNKLFALQEAQLRDDDAKPSFRRQNLQSELSYFDVKIAIERHLLALARLYWQWDLIEDPEYTRRLGVSFERVHSLCRWRWLIQRQLWRMDENSIEPGQKFAAALSVLYKWDRQRFARNERAVLRKADPDVTDFLRAGSLNMGFAGELVEGPLDWTPTFHCPIVPESLPEGLIQYIFRGGVNLCRLEQTSCLPMTGDIQINWVMYSFALLPLVPNDAEPRNWKVKVTDWSEFATMWRMATCHGQFMSVGMFEKFQFRFEGRVRPEKRFLYYHFIVAVLRAKMYHLPGCYELLKCLRSFPFGQTGCFIRRSMARALARFAGLSQMDEDALCHKGLTFEGEDRLKPEEEEEIARRCLFGTRRPKEEPIIFSNYHQQWKEPLCFNYSEDGWSSDEETPLVFR